ncbi:MAG: hypothetical protein ABI855_16285 [Bacteroidota bacterium]
MTLREWKALPPNEQRLLFYHVLKPNDEWQSVSIPEIFEEEFNELNNQYKNEKGIPLKVFQKWYRERFE